MPKKQSKKQSGTWFFKCIQQCEFAQDTWTPDEVIAVPAGTEVPAEWFEEIGRLPYASACLAIDASDRPRISIGKSDKGEFRYISITDLPEYALRAAKALPCSGILGNSVVLSISVDGCRAKLAFLEAYVFYTVAVVRAIEKAGDRNIALFPPTEVPAHWGLSGWDMVLRRRFEWDLLEEYALWQKNGRPGPFEDWLDTRRPGLFQSTGRPGEQVLEDEAPSDGKFVLAQDDDPTQEIQTSRGGPIQPRWPPYKPALLETLRKYKGNKPFPSTVFARFKRDNPDLFAGLTQKDTEDFWETYRKNYHNTLWEESRTPPGISLKKPPVK